MISAKAFKNRGQIRGWWWPPGVVSTVLVGFALFSESAKSDALDICWEGANAVNQQAPMDIGSGAVIHNAVCVMDGRKPRLIYRIRLDVAEGVLNQSAIGQLKAEQLKGWCTHPTTKPLLEVVNVRYLYSDRSNNYLGQTNISVSECAK